MPDNPLGNILYPRHCRVGVSPDKSQLAFTFGFLDQPPVTIALPIEGAVGLQRNLAQCLYLLGVRPAAKQDQPPAEPAPTADSAPGQP